MIFEAIGMRISEGSAELRMSVKEMFFDTSSDHYLQVQQELPPSSGGCKVIEFYGVSKALSDGPRPHLHERKPYVNLPSVNTHRIGCESRSSIEYMETRRGL